MNIRIILTIVTFLVLFLSGCGPASNVQQPPEIIYGQDVCTRCGMIISEERFASAYWTESGEARLFDDIGGMLAYTDDKQENAASYWVHDFDSGNWTRAEEAHYLLDSNLHTPMGFGIAAFSDVEQARAFAYGQGDVRILTFADLLDMTIKMPTDLHEVTHAGMSHTE